MRLQFTIDDTLGHELQENAEILGLSISSYVRLLIKRSISKHSLIDLALDDVENGRVEKISLEDFKKQLLD
jgi:antitoxin component of RelBE/YafQ-DinJ toxin-antitoxin module